MCEEFGCLPNEAIKALENDPDHLLGTIMVMRSFVHAKSLYEGAKKMSDLPNNDPMIALVQEIEFDQVEKKNKGED